MRKFLNLFYLDFNFDSSNFEIKGNWSVVVKASNLIFLRILHFRVTGLQRKINMVNL